MATLDFLLSIFITVPILPSYLHDLETDGHSSAEIATHTTDNGMTQPHLEATVTSSDHDINDDYDDATTRRFALASDSFYEWVDGSIRPADSQWLWDRWMWLHQNWTDDFPDAVDNGTIGDDLAAMLASRDAREAAFQQEDGRVGWLLAAKAIVQLMANPIVGILVNRFVSMPVAATRHRQPPHLRCR
jgi:hypothetical protein